MNENRRSRRRKWSGRGFTNMRIEDAVMRNEEENGKL